MSGEFGQPGAVLDHAAAVGAAIRAPSLHNSQPWRFRRRATADQGDLIELRLDPRRRLPASDPTGWAARVAGGAALMNLRLAVSVQGWEPRVRLLPDEADPDLLATVAPGRARPASPADVRLWEALWRRHSNRAPFWPDSVPSGERSRLVEAAGAEGAWLALLIGPGPVNVLAEVARAADQALSRDPAYRAELASLAAESRLPAAAGLPPAPQDLLPQRAYGEPGRDRGAGREYEQQPLVAVLGTVADTPGDQLVAGQALQRVLLTATADGLAASMLSQPIEVPRAREELRIALHRSGPPQMVLRIGYASQPREPTPRRPVAEFIDELVTG